MVVYVGIDPGISGAIAALWPDHELVEVFDLPTLEVRVGGAKRRVLDLHVTRSALNVIVKRLGGPVFAAVEAQHALPTSMKGSQSNFSLGRTFGALEALLVAAEISYELVPSNTWKRAVGLQPKATKGDAVKLARQRWPSLVPRLLISKDGRSEALLIAEWRRRQNSMEALPDGGSIER